jgi:hypothetical protein
MSRKKAAAALSLFAPEQLDPRPQPAIEPLPAKVEPPPIHYCHARGCRVECDPHRLMCPPHWRMVPEPLQRAVWKHYREGQEDRKDPSAAWMKAADAAIEAVQRIEKERAARQGQLPQAAPPPTWADPPEVAARIRATLAAIGWKDGSGERDAQGRVVERLSEARLFGLQSLLWEGVRATQNAMYAGTTWEHVPRPRLRVEYETDRKGNRWRVLVSTDEKGRVTRTVTGPAPLETLPDDDPGEYE